MPIDPPVILLIAAIALSVASIVARRAGMHADRLAGRRRTADRRGPFGAVADVLDQSVAAYLIRRRLGVSTLTLAERRAGGGRAAATAHADSIRPLHSGPPPPARPARLVVAGASTGHTGSAADRAMPGRSTLLVELLAAALGLAVVVGIVVGIWPRETGGVLSATGRPAASVAPSHAPTPTPTTTPEPTAT